ncbi:hypothetical protein GCM10027578_25340 [Spirosoma luteolum]
MKQTLLTLALGLTIGIGSACAQAASPKAGAAKSSAAMKPATGQAPPKGTGTDATTDPVTKQNNKPIPPSVVPARTKADVQKEASGKVRPGSHDAQWDTPVGRKQAPKNLGPAKKDGK